MVLCGTPSATGDDIPHGVATLAGLPGMSVVSASYGLYLEGFGEQATEKQWDSTIIQPAVAANPDVSLFAASGDEGSFLGPAYPAASPEVVGVGGTLLSLSATGGYGSETGAFFSGGGYVTAFPLPSYQQGDGFPGNSNGFRTAPDVAAVAGPGLAVYDPFDLGTSTPWGGGGGDERLDLAVGRPGRDR